MKILVKRFWGHVKYIITVLPHSNSYSKSEQNFPPCNSLIFSLGASSFALAAYIFQSILSLASICAVVSRHFLGGA
jgi:hypothetical protein